MIITPIFFGTVIRFQLRRGRGHGWLTSVDTKLAIPTRSLAPGISDTPNIDGSRLSNCYCQNEEEPLNFSLSAKPIFV